MTTITPDWFTSPGEAMTSYRSAFGGPGAVPWMPSPLDPRLRYVPAQDLARMRDRSRQLQRDNAVAAGMFQRMTENVIGQGFGLQPTTADPDWNLRAHELMESWFGTADSSGLTWLEHLRLAYMSSRRDGDCATVLIDDGTLQLLEGDLIASQPGKLANTVDGVTIGPRGRPVAFTFRTVDLSGKWTWKQIDAKDVIFYPRITRPGQVRGEPILAPNLELFEQFDGIIEAVVAAVRVAACQSLYIQRDDDRDWTQAVVDASGRPMGMPPAAPGCPPTGPGPCPPGQSPIPPGRRRPPEMRMRPGGVMVGKPGDKVTQITPTQPGDKFTDTVRTLVRLLGLPMGMPLELSLLDVSQSSGPTARAAMLQAFRTFATEQKIFAQRYLARVYRWRVSKFIKTGDIEYRPDYFNHRWIAPRWPMMDPVKEMQARQMAVDIGEETLDDQLKEQGKTFAKWVEQRSGELRAMREGEVPVYHSMAFQGETPSPAGTGPAKPTRPTDPDDDDADDTDPAGPVDD